MTKRVIIFQNDSEICGQIKVCSKCGSTNTSMENTKCGIYAHWYGTADTPVCKKCYNRIKNQKLLPKNVCCNRCGSSQSTVTPYGTLRWVRDKDSLGRYLCWSCYVAKRNTGRTYTIEQRNNIRRVILAALNAGVTIGRKIYTLNESCFDVLTENAAYWIGFLMADGNIHKGRQGSPVVRLTISEKDYGHLIKFRRFLGSTHKIFLSKATCRGKLYLQPSIKIPSRKIVERLATFGVVPQKSLTAKVIGLEKDRHFWRGVLDGDGYLECRNGQNTDRIVLVGSYSLLVQFKAFIETAIPNSIVKIRPHGRIYSAYILASGARAAAKLLYEGSSIFLERKLKTAYKIFQTNDGRKKRKPSK